MDIETLAVNLKRYREGRGLTKRELAALAGMDDASLLTRYEKGQVARPGHDKVAALALALGVTIDDLSRKWDLVPVRAGLPASEPTSTQLQGVIERIEMLESAVVLRHDARRFRFVGGASADPSSGTSLSDDEPDGARFFLEVDGDCLAPEINIGDVLMMTANKEPKPGDVVGVVVHGERHVKRVTKKNGGMILDSKRGRLVLPMEGATVEGVMIDKYKRY